MTRINVVPVEELSDQHLIREYQELPRCIKQNINTDDAPLVYKLGTGHMKWAKKHSFFLVDRYFELCGEMIYRGFKVNYPASSLQKCALKTVIYNNENSYKPTNEDLQTNSQRLIEKYKMKPDWYRWTKREKPNYMEDIK